MIPAVVTAGDRRAAKAVYGESKVYLELGGLPLVAHVVAVLQQVPEVSEVWVVGNEERLKGVFERPEVRARLAKPLHIVAQFRNLYENAWETFRRILPGAGPEGRDPVSEADLDQRVLYLPGDLPFATPQEISAFIRRGLANGCVYSVGLATDESLQDFYPSWHHEVVYEINKHPRQTSSGFPENVRQWGVARQSPRNLQVRVEHLYNNHAHGDAWELGVNHHRHT
jgi:molybdopterin-guanine dinucleotide biosynthesis protein A